MTKMLLLTTVVIASLAAGGAARADLVLSGGSVDASFTGIGGSGFGALPRLLNLQTNGSETGSNTPTGPTGDAKCNGSFFCSLPTLTQAGWTTPANVGVGVNWDQTGQNGAQLNALTLTIYNGTTSVGSFPLDPTLIPVLFSNAELAREPGNGNAVFLFVLNATEQAQFATILAMNGSANFVAGLGASAGCATGVTCTFVSDDGPDSFVAVNASNPVSVPGPVAGAGLPGLLAACFGLLAFARRRRNRTA